MADASPRQPSDEKAWAQRLARTGASPSYGRLRDMLPESAAAFAAEELTPIFETTTDEQPEK